MNLVCRQFGGVAATSKTVNHARFTRKSVVYKDFTSKSFKLKDLANLPA
jgi:hypothetical protein